MNITNHNTLPLQENEQSHERELSELDLRLLGATCMAKTVEVPVLEHHESLLENPNTYNGTSMFSSGEIPTDSDKVYRQVHLSAIQDLAETGIVRNGATARGEENKRWGHRVFWNSGREGTAVSTGGRAVIVASKEAASKGWVTTKDIDAIHVNHDGRVMNILEQPEA